MTDTAKSATEITYIARDTGHDDEEYEIAGILLPDGRVLTYGTGVDGGDTLWADLDDIRPNGHDTLVTWTTGGPAEAPSIDDLENATQDDSLLGAGYDIVTISERGDLVVWLQDHKGDIGALPHGESYIGGLATELQNGDHPRWGGDWSRWLQETITDDLVDSVCARVDDVLGVS